jgi:hypothetical protein
MIINDKNIFEAITEIDIDNLVLKFEDEDVFSLIFLVRNILPDMIKHDTLYNSIADYIQFRNLYVNLKSTTLKEDFLRESSN